MLNDFLKQAVKTELCDKSVADVILAMAEASKQIARLAKRTGLADSDFAVLAGGNNADGDDQKALDVLADDEITVRLKTAGVAVYLSEEQDTPIVLNAGGAIMVAADPLDGSSNIDTNLSVGTIFSLLPAPEMTSNQVTEQACLMTGRSQLAAGFILYGPQTGMLLTLGDGVVFFVLNEDNQYEQADWVPDIPASYPEFAINMSNMRSWPPAVAAYIDNLLAEADKSKGTRYNMKWCASLVADAFRIFRRGGIFLYPEDSRTGYEEGRLRLIYEAHPISFLIEQAGGSATDGRQAILDKVADRFHARTSFIFGSSDEVHHYIKLYQQDD